MIISLMMPESYIGETLSLQAKTTEISAQKKKPAKSKRKKRRTYVAPVRIKYPKDMKILHEQQLSEGVIYRKIVWGDGFKHHIHLIQADIGANGIYPKVLKAHNHNTGLEKLHGIVERINNTNMEIVLGAVNANFWRAGTHYPIGPTVIDGEIVELPTHKSWSSVFFDYENKPYIDNFYLSGNLLRGNRAYSIGNVNRRRDTNGIVIYNRYSGDFIPYISSVNIAAEINSQLDEIRQELTFSDSTETEIDSVSLIRELIETKQLANSEFRIFKASCNYISGPGVNKETKAVVTAVNRGGMTMPLNGFIVSFGLDYLEKDLPKIGDTIAVRFETNIHKSIQFFNSISGTPRLVRNGIAGHEAQKEGSTGRRFISSQLPRTAIGVDRTKNVLFLVAVEATSRGEKKAGATLSNLAEIMRKIGAYDAMNLDGGGSSIMLIDNMNVLLPNQPNVGRRISTAIGIIQVR